MFSPTAVAARQPRVGAEGLGKGVRGEPSDLARLVSRFAESSMSLQVRSERSSPLPQIVAENMDDGAIMRIWELDALEEGVRMGFITLALAMRAKSNEGRRGA